MFTIIGIVVALVCVMTAYALHHGQFGIFISAYTEFIIILGGGFGMFLSANGMNGVKTTMAATMGLLKPDPTSKSAYLDLLKMLYQLFTIARKEGLLGLESHIEKPEESDIISKYPQFLAKHHALHFFSDTMKVILTGAVGPHDLAEMMELDLEIAHEEAKLPADAVQNVADAMPAIGIVAAVLGVIITMGSIAEGAVTVGQKVAGALVGTFAGVLFGYLVFGPISRALTLRLRGEEQYLSCLRYALFSFARGESPLTCVEFARRNIDPSVRPSYDEMEQTVKQRDAA